MNFSLANIIWFVFMSIIAFIAGAYFNLGYLEIAGDGYILNYIVGGIAMVVALCGVAFFYYIVMKDDGEKNPTQKSLLVFSGFTLVFVIIAGIKYPSVIENRENELFVEEFRIEYQNHLLSEYKATTDSIVEAEQIELITFAELLCEDLASRKKLVNELKNSKDPIEYAQRSPRFRKRVYSWMEVFHDSELPDEFPYLKPSY